MLKKEVIILILVCILSLPLVFSYSIFPRPIVDNEFFPNTPFIFQFNFTDDSGVVLLTNTSTLTTDSSGIAFTSLNISSLTSVPTRFLHWRNDTGIIVNKTFPDVIFSKVLSKDTLFERMNATNAEIENNLLVGENITTTNLNVTGTFWAGDLIWDGNLNLGGNNITNIDKISVLDWTNVTISNSQISDPIWQVGMYGENTASLKSPVNRIIMEQLQLDDAVLSFQPNGGDRQMINMSDGEEGFSFVNTDGDFVFFDTTAGENKINLSLRDLLLQGGDIWVRSDSAKTYWGLSDDVSARFDGADFKILTEVGTPDLNISGFGNVIIDGTSELYDDIVSQGHSYVIQTQSDWGGWARGTNKFINTSADLMMEVGGVGSSPDVMGYIYIGNAWNDRIATFNKDLTRTYYGRSTQTGAGAGATYDSSTYASVIIDKSALNQFAQLSFKTAGTSNWWIITPDGDNYGDGDELLLTTPAGYDADKPEFELNPDGNLYLRSNLNVTNGKNITIDSAFTGSCSSVNYVGGIAISCND